MGTQGAGRRRSSNKERSTAEDDALNLIAREAEARLAAKRAARAEAREIRMKELERQQKELSDDDERMSVGSRGSVRVEDRDYVEKGSRAASALTATTLTSLGGSSSRRGSGDTAITLDPETSTREIKDTLTEVEEKYRKAMVSNAQLDNEKSNLMYQVDTLKDSLMELEELLSESRRDYDEKLKECDREKHAHTVLQFQFSDMKETLKQSEELLNKHGIVLGPDLSINGEIVEAEGEGSSSGDPAARTAQVSQTSPTEGNSMLGNTQDTQLRSNGEEELDPEQHQEMLEDITASPSISDAPCNVDIVSTLETSQEEPQTLTTVENAAVGSGPSEDLEVKIDAENILVSCADVQEAVASPGENDAEIENLVREDLGGETSQDLGEMGTEEVSPDVSETVRIETSDDMRQMCSKLSEDQLERLEDVEGSKLAPKDIDSCPQQEANENILNKMAPDDPTPTVSNAEPEPELVDEAENDEVEETSSKSQPQGAAASSGKKKKRKRRGKKKGGGQEDKKEPKDAKVESATETKSNKPEKDLEMAVSDKMLVVEAEVSGPYILKELGTEQVEIGQDKQHVLEVEEVVGGKLTEMLPSVETLRTDGVEVEQDLILESEKVEPESVMSPDPESNHSTSDLTENSKNPEVTNDPDRDATDILADSDSKHIESGIADSGGDEIVEAVIRLEGTDKNLEISCETTNGSSKTEVKPHEPNSVDVAPEYTKDSDDEAMVLVAPSHTESFTERPESSSGSESKQYATANSDVNAEIEVSAAAAEEVIEMVDDEEDEGVEMDQEFFCGGVTSSNDEIKEDETSDQELEDLVQLDSSLVPLQAVAGKTDGGDEAANFLEPVAQTDGVDDISCTEVQTPTLQFVDQSLKLNAEASLEMEESDTVERVEMNPSQEAPGICSLREQDCGDENAAGVEDLQLVEGSISLCPPANQQPESSIDEPENNDSSQPMQEDSGEEDNDDDEGQSFDFDDMDAGVAMNLPLNSAHEEVEVVSCDDAEPQQRAQDEPGEGDKENSTDDEGITLVDTTELGHVFEEDQPPSAEEKTGGSENEEKENMCEQQKTEEAEASVRDILEGEVEGVENAVELGAVEGSGAENVDQAMALPVDKGVDAVKMDLQSEALDSQKAEEQAGGSRAEPRARKDSKKNGKKGKGKGKEDCLTS
ncbi:uncharacterized protein lrrfip1a isoform X2 [Genypterus blacodes]|uniref:uncharacterized protein lrrfip1a isoform X2 n=1 Tax=Genypterus blacodes TaxID=154954 RepID=UPI003F765ECD